MWTKCPTYSFFKKSKNLRPPTLLTVFPIRLNHRSNPLKVALYRKLAVRILGTSMARALKSVPHPRKYKNKTNTAALLRNIAGKK